jgi:hypothetical protein
MSSRFALMGLCMLLSLLTFSARADDFGYTAVGTTAYPTSGFEQVATLSIPGVDGIVESHLDGVHNVLYCRTNSQILKVPLPIGSGEMTAVSNSVLDGNFTAFAIDPAGGHIYVGTDSNPGRAIKLEMGAAGEAPKRLGAIFLGAGETPISTVVLDTTNGYAYYGTTSDPGRIVKVRMGTGSAPPVRVGAPPTVDVGGFVKFGTVNAAEGFVLFGIVFGNSDLRLVKFDAGGGDAAPVRVPGSTALIGSTTDVSVHLASNTCYVVPNTPNEIRAYKVDMGAGTTLPTILATLGPFGPPSITADFADLDPTGAYLYLGVRTPGEFNYHKLDTATMTSLGAVTALPAEANSRSGGIIPGLGLGYSVGFGPDLATPVYLVEYDLGAGAAVPTRLRATRLPQAGRGLTSFAADEGNGYAYLGGSDTDVTGRITKIAYFPEMDTPPEIRSVYVAPETHGSFRQLAFDPIRDVLYGISISRASSGEPQRFMKFSPGLLDAPPVEIASIPVGTPWVNMVCDFANNYGYLVTATSITKYDLGTGSATPTAIGSTPLAGIEGDFRRGLALDSVNNKLYVVRQSSPARIFKISLGAGTALPSLDGTLQIGGGTPIVEISGIDPADGYGLATLSSGNLLRFTVDGTTNAPVQTSIQSNFSLSVIGAFDPDSDTGLYAGPTTLTRVDFGGVSGPAIVNGYTSMSAWGTFFGPTSAVTSLYRDGSSHLFATRSGAPAQLLKFSAARAYPMANKLRTVRITVPSTTEATSIRFYSHMPAGKFRFAIFAGSGLVWQSGEIANSVSEDFITVPISLGTPPTLVLGRASGPSLYYLAFVSDSDDPVASFIPSEPPEGLLLDMEYGSFPSSFPTSTSPGQGAWSIHLNGNPLPRLTMIDAVDADGLNDAQPGYTNDPTVNVLTTFSGTMPTSIQFSEDDFATETSLAYSSPLPYTLTDTADGLKTIKARITTIQGTASPIADTIFLDRTPPVCTLSSADVSEGESTENSSILMFLDTGESAGLWGLNTNPGGDLAISGAVPAPASSASGGRHTFRVLHFSGGPVSIQLPAGAASDKAGNLNPASNVFTYTYIAPAGTSGGWQLYE